MNAHTAAMFGGIALTACSQLLLKSGAASGGTWLGSLAHGRTLAGLALFAVVTVMNVYALQGVGLSTFVAWSALTFVLVVIAARLAFREKLSARKLLGAGLIIGGIVLFSLAS